MSDSNIQTDSHQRLNANARINALFGIIGIYTLGVFLTWFFSVILPIPAPDSVVWRSFTSTMLQTVCTIFIPIFWAVIRLEFQLQDLGISTYNIWKSTILGCLLYSLALGAFVHCSSDPLISNHAVGKLDLSSAIGLLASMSIVAAGTDFATRGFVLFTVARYANIPIAVILQNLTWFLGHIHEIDLLSNCLGYWYAVSLTLTLGIIGDVIALKTRNIIGLAISHILLNVSLFIYIRIFL